MKTILTSAVVAAFVTLGLAFLVPASQPNPGALPAYQNSTFPNFATYLGSKTLAGFSLGPLTASTSSATTSVPLLKGLTWGLALGDTCTVQLSSASSTQGWSADAQITAIATSSATSTVTFFNGANAITTVTTGTLKVICNHY